MGKYKRVREVMNSPIRPENMESYLWKYFHTYTESVPACQAGSGAQRYDLMRGTGSYRHIQVTRRLTTPPIHCMNHASTASRLVKRQFNDEGCPPHVIVFRANCASVLLDDSFGDGQTQSRAFARIFPGKERLKNFVQFSRKDTMTVVGDNQTDGWFPRGHFWTRYGNNHSFRMVIRHRIAGVEDKIDHHLHQPVSFHFFRDDLRRGIVLDMDAIFFNPALRHLQTHFDGMAEVAAGKQLWPLGGGLK